MKKNINLITSHGVQVFQPSRFNHPRNAKERQTALKVILTYFNLISSQFLLSWEGILLRQLPFQVNSSSDLELEISFGPIKE
jgi:hypothetical protein